MKFSLEIGPNTDLETVPPVNDVYITMLPGGDYKETANKVLKKLNQLGFKVNNLDKYLNRKTLLNKKQAEKYIDTLLK